MTKQQKLILGSTVFLLMFLYWGVTSWFSIAALRTASECGLDIIQRDDQIVIAKINLENYSPILHPGDEILGIRGMNPDSAKSLLDGTMNLMPGAQTTLFVKCQGNLYEVPVTTQPLSWSRWLRGIGNLIAPWTFLLIGALLLLLRQGQEQAWLLSIMLGTFVGLFGAGVQELPPALMFFFSLARAFGILFFPLFFNFFLIFPEKSKWIQGWPQIKLWLFVPFLCFILPFNLLGRFQPYTNKFFELFPEWLLYSFNWMTSALILLYLVGGLLSLAASYRIASRDTRRKLHLIVAGCSAGILNILIIVALEQFNGAKHWGNIYSWLQFLANFTLPLIPISFAYAIVKHQIIPISLIIRRGMRYILVSHGSVLLEIGIFFAVIITFLSAFFRWLFTSFHPKDMQTLWLTVGLISATTGIMLWNLTRFLHTKYLAPVIDRRFFRESYDSQRIISELVESLRTTTDQEHLLAQIATKIRSALQTESVAILLRSSVAGDYKSAYYCAYNPVDGGSIHCSNDFSLPSTSKIIARLRGTREPVNIDEEALPNDEIKLLRQIKSELLLPLSSQKELLGIVSLGSRLGDLPFSTEDKELLMSVAGPGTFALENAQLLERMIEEARRREEIETENEARAKELEEARQIQLSMLPHKVPCLPHLDIAAYMKTATEVGGDYYDFHVSPEGVLTVVVGDATGHGLKAGTIVTATKSLFNNLAGLNDIPEIFRQSSNALKMMNLRALYMAMTMAKLKGYELTVSLAGMPALLIYRAQTNTVEEIALRAMPLGSIKNYVYKQQTTTLEIGDIVVLLSDGFPERFDPSGEILGFEKAGEILADSGSLSAQQLINKFIQIGDAWGASRPQDDDVTFVVLKIIKPPAF